MSVRIRLRAPRSVPAALALALAAGGCVAGGGGQAATFEDTRVAVGECLFGRTEAEAALGAALLAAVLPSLVSEGVSLVGGFLKAAGETRTVSSPPRFANFVARADAAPQCVQVVRGRFHAARAELPAVYAPDWAAGMQIDGISASRLVNTLKIYPAARPDFLFEGTFARAGATDAYTIIPRHVVLNEPIERPILGFDASRVLSLALDVFGPNAGAGNPLATAAISMGRLRPGEPICLEPVRGETRSRGGTCRSAGEVAQSVPATPLPSAAPSRLGGLGSLGVGGAAGTGAGTAGATAPPPTLTARPALAWEGPSRPFEATWFTLPFGPQSAAYSLLAVVTETRTGSEAAAFLSRAFEASRAGITTALTTAAEEALLRERRDAVATRRAEPKRARKRPRRSTRSCATRWRSSRPAPARPTPPRCCSRRARRVERRRR